MFSSPNTREPASHVLSTKGEVTMDPRTSGTSVGTYGQTEIPSLERLKGMDVCDRDGEKIGSVDSIYTDRETGQNVRYVSVSTGWLGIRRHVVPLDDVEWSKGGDYLVLPYGRPQLESAPTYDERHELSDDDEERIYGYYGRSGYWDAVRAKQTTPAPTREIAEAEVADALDRGDDPLRTDISGNGDRTEVRTDHPGRRTMTAQGADRFGDPDVPGRGHRIRRGVRRHEW